MNTAQTPKIKPAANDQTPSMVRDLIDRMVYLQKTYGTLEDNCCCKGDMCAKTEEMYARWFDEHNSITNLLINCPIQNSSHAFVVFYIGLQHLSDLVGSEPHLTEKYHSLRAAFDFIQNNGCLGKVPDVVNTKRLKPAPRYLPRPLAQY